MWGGQLAIVSVAHVSSVEDARPLLICLSIQCQCSRHTCQCSLNFSPVLATSLHTCEERLLPGEKGNGRGGERVHEGMQLAQDDAQEGFREHSKYDVWLRGPLTPTWANAMGWAEDGGERDQRSAVRYTRIR